MTTSAQLCSQTSGSEVLESSHHLWTWWLPSLHSQLSGNTLQTEISPRQTCWSGRCSIAWMRAQWHHLHSDPCRSPWESRRSSSTTASSFQAWATQIPWTSIQQHCCIRCSMSSQEILLEEYHGSSNAHTPVEALPGSRSSQESLLMALL